MTDEEMLDLVISLIDQGMSVAGAILAAVELDEATPVAVSRVQP